MKKSRFTDSQIIESLKRVEAGLAVPELCRELGISTATFYKWRSKYGGMLSPASRTGRQLGAWPQRGFIRCRLDASTIRCPHAAAPDFWRNRAQRPHSLCSREPAQRMCSSRRGQATLGLRPTRNVSGMVATLCAQSGVNVVNMAAALWRHVGHRVATRWR